MKYHLITLGCQMNKSDSERVRTVIDQMGYAWTDREEDADLLGVLACSVRQKAIDRVYTRIHRWNEMKASRAVITFVTGCVLPADQLKFLKLFDFVFTMNELPQFPEMLREYGVVNPAGLTMREWEPESAPVAAESGLISIDRLQGNGDRRPTMGGLWKIDATPQSSFEAYVPIQNGCDKFCTFCAVPYTRGREVSRPSQEIIDEVSSLVSRGYKSITLLGQNVNSYGLDKAGEEIGFAELLAAIGELGATHPDPFWVYFTSPHPRDMTDQVIDVMARYACIGNQVHLPLQSGDDRVLRRMNRQHSFAQYRRIVESIWERLPEATIFTDIIVGFTGESDAEFENTRKAFEEFGYDMAYVAHYSPRPGAASSRWEDDIALDVKRERYHVLNAILEAGAIERHEKMIGETIPVLVYRFDEKHSALMGLTEGRIKIRIDSDDQSLIGSFLDVTVNAVAGLALAGEPAMLAVAP
jgi:tRNA-2-methylthio-N6-dimethylallyladenosine synthase